MKKICRIKESCVRMLLTACIFLMISVTVAAANTGKITLQFPEEAEGAVITLYKAADIKDDAYIWTKEFADCGVSLTGKETSSEMLEKAETLAAYAAAQKIAGQEQQIKKKEPVIFGGLEKAVYLIAHTENRSQIHIQPMVVELPLKNSFQENPWEIQAVPKYTLPDSHGEPEAPSLPGKGTTTGRNPVKTGDNTKTGIFVLVLTVSAAAAGVILYKRKKRSSVH